MGGGIAREVGPDKLNRLGEKKERVAGKCGLFMLWIICPGKPYFCGACPSLKLKMATNWLLLVKLLL